MKIRWILQLSIKNIFRRKFRTLVHLIINTLANILILATAFLTLSSFYYIDHQLNRLDGELTFRQITLNYENKDDPIPIHTIDSIIRELCTIAHVEEVELMESSSHNRLEFIITVDDYRNVNNVISYFHHREGYNVVIDERTIVNVASIKVVKIASLTISSVVSILTFVALMMNVGNFAQDRRYEIALLKTLGYNDRDLFFLVLAESSMMMIISYGLAYSVTVCLFHFLMQSLAARFQLVFLLKDLNLHYILAFITGICYGLFSIILSRSILKKMSQISPYALLKQ